eukprot:666301-Pleurochrysis_carterae.AAC.1
MPSGRLNGPEKSKSTRRERAAAPITWSAVRTSCGDGIWSASGRPGGSEGSAGCGGIPAALIPLVWFEDHGKHDSSKYASE